MLGLFKKRKEKNLVDNDELVEILTKFKIDNIETVIDLGAAAGTWTKRVQQVYPNCKYLLVEPIEERQAELKKLQQDNNRVFIENVVVSDCKGEVSFSITDDLDGSGMYGDGNLRKVRAEKVDDLINNNGLSGPFLLKFDTHGYELNILRGSINTLKNTELIVMETYNFKISPDALKFWEICKIMDELGFRAIDFIEVMRRPKDNALWQLDIVFLKHTHPSFQSESYN